MESRKVKLVIGSLLHDIGKLLYRSSDGRNHSISGYDFLKEKTKINDYEILNCVKYHHASLLKAADINLDALCYITYIADNIAAFIDRREKTDHKEGFVRDIALESIFNILNENHGNHVYQANVFNSSSGMHYPVKDEVKFDEKFYADVIDNIKNSMHGLMFTADYINSLLEVLEANLTFIPSSTQTKELRDISLYDHGKITAAMSLCICDYLEENKTTDLREELFVNAKTFYGKKVFMIYSMDISGIQDFIYTVSSAGALKGLRARSFYLEMLMEHIVDHLLDELQLARTNVLYTGGGHAYLLLPATQKTKNVLRNFENEVNDWFVTNFKTALFIGGGFCECSGNELRNEPDGSYEEIFRTVSNCISQKKLTRYNKNDIIRLNQKGREKQERECKVCFRTDRLTKDGKCEICSNLEHLAKDILYRNFFVIVHKKPNEPYLPLPFGNYLILYEQSELRDKMKQEDYIRAYCKNKQYTGYGIVTKLWVGDYAAKGSFKELAENARGIKRLAVLRADVDNLGQAFVSGFKRMLEGNRFVTISRTSVFSKKLAIFFKLHMNAILSKGEYYLYPDSEQSERNAVIVYSGGDDVFIVGGWDDIIGFAVDLYRSLKRFTQGTLTVSAGIGLFTDTYPISAMAEETGVLEEVSKSYEGKNAVTLFDENNSYAWDEFIDKVLGEKLEKLITFFKDNEERGKNMLYQMLELIRKREEEDRLNIARFSYLLARLCPDQKNSPQEIIKRYKEFAKNMYDWIRDDKESKQLTTAIYIYAYMYRERKDTDGAKE